MEFELSFDSIKLQESTFYNDQIGASIHTYTKDGFPDLTESDVVMFGLNEYRGTNYRNDDDQLLNNVRSSFYNLYQGQNRIRIADLGNLKIGHKKSDTIHLLSEVLVECERRNLFAIIIGGSHDMTLAQYDACVVQNKICSLVNIDRSIDFGKSTEESNSKNFMSHIISRSPSLLFNFSNIGHQSYFTSVAHHDLIDKLFFDAVRLGDISNDLQEIEPYTRNADFASIDMRSIKMQDFPAQYDGSPNGFDSKEICQIARYFGVSSRLTSLGLYEIFNAKDVNQQSASLIAQMLWCFLDGYFHKMKDVKATDVDMVKYHVSLRAGEFNAVFYKNKKIDKWWMEIPLLTKDSSFQNQCFMPCSYSDYLIASKGEMPNRWWKAFQKMN